MKKVFVSYSYSQRRSFEELHQKLKNFLQEALGYQIYAFVFDFTDTLTDKEIMREAFSRIDQADIVIAELSYKSVGVGIEAGYAKAKGKPVIYLHRKGTDLKQTMNGIADSVISYEDENNLIEQLARLPAFNP